MSSKKKTAVTKDDGSPTLVPKLRFPEFREADSWKDMPVESILIVRDEMRVPTAEAPLYSLTIENGITEKTARYNREFLVRDAGNKKYKLVEPNDIVYNPSNLRWGAINYSQLSHSVVVSPIYEVLRLRDSSEDFLEFIACSVMRVEQIGRFITKGQGTLVERIAVKIEDFLSTRLPVPATRAEQQKIAECLSSVDELMAAQARKVDALKTHKKGLMQQLFPREGETQPRLRFPEFQNAGEWVVKPLGELVELQSGFAFSSNSFGSEGRKLVTPKNFTKFGRGNFDESVSKYTTEDVPERFVCKPGDLLVLLTDLTPTCELLGKPLLLEEKDGTVLLNQRVVRVEVSSPELVTLFLKYVFLSEAYNTLIIKTATGSTVKHSSNKVLLEMELVHPSPEEQQRIAACLTSLDDLIAAQTQKLEVLKTHKKGLMQQLFPSPEEMP